VLIFTSVSISLTGDLVPTPASRASRTTTSAAVPRGRRRHHGDGFDDIVVSRGSAAAAGLHLHGAAIARGMSLTRGDFFLFEQALRNGAYVAVGDVKRDGWPTSSAAAPAARPRLIVTAGALERRGRLRRHDSIANFFSGNTDSRGGVRSP